MNRRDLLGSAALLATSAVPAPAAAGTGTVRDRLWLWCHTAGSHNRYKIPKPSRITPVEAAVYMSIPNLIQVRYENTPAPPFEQYAIPFRTMNNVVWSVVGEAGRTEATERDHVIAMAQRQPNLTGVMMDDFFKRPKDGALASLTVAELRQLQQQLKAGPKKLDLWAVLYDHQLDMPVADHLAECDVVSYWTWKGADLGDLAANFARAAKLAPKARKVLGLYMFDFGQNRAMPVDLMRKQTELGLEWLREGRIEGMIFLASCICDVGLESVEWTREWIQKTGGTKLKTRRTAQK